MPHIQYTSNRFEPEEVGKLEKYLKDNFILDLGERESIYEGTVHLDQEAFCLYRSTTVLNLYVQGPDKAELDKIGKKFLFLNPKFPVESPSRKRLEKIASDIDNLPIFNPEKIKNSTNLKAELGYLI